jgi:hypothetical protein
VQRAWLGHPNRFPAEAVPFSVREVAPIPVQAIRRPFRCWVQGSCVSGAAWWGRMVLAASGKARWLPFVL